MYVLNILVCVSRNSNSEWSLWNKSETLINDLLTILSQNYNLLVDDVNEELAFLCEFFNKVKFLVHYKDNWEKLLDSDGTHLNEKGKK